MNKPLFWKYKILIVMITALGFMIPLLTQAADPKGFFKSGEKPIFAANIISDKKT